MPIVPKPSQQAADASIAAYQPIIDACISANQAIYDQQTSLQQQLVALNQQLSVVNAQIAELEAGDVTSARAAINMIILIANGQAGNLKRIAGLNVSAAP